MTKRTLALATSLLILIGFVAGIDNYVYPRREGEKLEGRIERIDKRVNQSEKRLKGDISKMVKQINSIYMILIKKSGKTI